MKQTEKLHACQYVINVNSRGGIHGRQPAKRARGKNELSVLNELCLCVNIKDRVENSIMTNATETKHYSGVCVI